MNSLHQDLAVIKTKDTALDIKLSKLLHLLTNIPKESIFLKEYSQKIEKYNNENSDNLNNNLFDKMKQIDATLTAIQTEISQEEVEKSILK